MAGLHNSVVYENRQNLFQNKSISKLYRIGNAHDMPTKFNATQLQNVWVNMPKNPEGQK